MQILIYVLFVLLVLWLIAIRPENGRRERMRAFSKTYIAHRGLHDKEAGIPENSLAAFKRAVEAGYGIELDVRLTRDGQLAVVHDDKLKRVAGLDKRVTQMTMSEVREVRLWGTEEQIPTFQEVLKMVDGRVPLVVEIKCEDRHYLKEICENTAFWLDNYRGLTCVESFHPLVLNWFRRHHPQTLRGQLSDRFRKGGPFKALGGFFLSLCLCNFLTRPDFIAYNIHYATLLRYQMIRFLHGFGVGWTVRSKEELQGAKRDFEAFIFEDFLPGKPKLEEERSEGDGKAMTDAIRLHLLVSGEVQGVGFRYRACRIAQDLGVTGWVRNLYDLRVEMEVQGTRLMIDQMMDRLGNERFIRITDIEESEIPVDPHDYEFKVRDGI
jgi:glycerophosphoryl diester phosphodiesterase/acylphosphatase